MRKGLTILEAMVALSLIGLTSLAVLEALATQLQGAARMRDASFRLDLAREQLARLELLPGDVLGALPDSLRAGEATTEHDNLSWRASTKLVGGTAVLYELAVRVSGRSGVTELHTRVFRPAITDTDGTP